MKKRIQRPRKSNIKVVFREIRSFTLEQLVEAYKQVEAKTSNYSAIQRAYITQLYEEHVRLGNITDDGRIIAKSSIETMNLKK